jgi:hypothetical protein
MMMGMVDVEAAGVAQFRLVITWALHTKWVSAWQSAIDMEYKGQLTGAMEAFQGFNSY